jgi:hypothetical protein
MVLTSRKTSYNVVGARELLGTFQTLESPEELLFSFYRKLTPASVLQSLILVGTLGDRTLVWRVQCEPQKGPYNESRVEHRQSAERARLGLRRRFQSDGRGRPSLHMLRLFSVCYGARGSPR